MFHRRDAKDAEKDFTTETRRHREYDAFVGSGDFDPPKTLALRARV
jgi:hypothetical protein